MELLVCGTAAAEAWPALFCHCEPCRRARELGGKNIRARSGYLLGDSIKIDFGPDAAHQLHTYGTDSSRIAHLLVTHSHEDHWTPHELGYRWPGFSHVPEGAVLTLYGNAKVRQKTEARLAREWERLQLRFVDLSPFEPVEVTEGVVATPLRAAHDSSEVCLNFLLERGGRRLVIGHDTGFWPEDTWEFLRNKPIHIALMDCTCGKQDHHQGHMGCSWVVKTRDRLSEQGSLAEDCLFYATHFSHNGGWLHHELEEYLVPRGVQVAYDGLRLEL